MIGERTFPVAHDGEVFFLGLEASNDISVRLGNSVCKFRLTYAASNDLLPHLGAYICQLR